MKYWAMTISLLLLTVLLSGFVGYHTAMELNPPPKPMIVREVITREVVKEVPIEIIKEVPIEVIKEVPIEVIKEVKVDRWRYKELRHFDNLTELKDWLARDIVFSIYFNEVDKETGKIIDKFDCDDFAYALQERAAKDGYFISTEIIGSGYNLHMLNSVTIDNKVYFIEPQDNTVWFFCDRG